MERSCDSTCRHHPENTGKQSCSSSTLGPCYPPDYKNFKPVEKRSCDSTCKNHSSNNMTGCFDRECYTPEFKGFEPVEKEGFQIVPISEEQFDVMYNLLLPTKSGSKNNLIENGFIIQELKPCPLCEEEVSRDIYTYSPIKYEIACSCGLSFRPREETNKNMFNTLWNRIKR